MHTEILDNQRQKLLPVMAAFKERFYLAGGTALALQIGHRQSIDFDFFTDVEFDPNALFTGSIDLLAKHAVAQVQNEKNTLSIVVDGIKISFFYTPYPLLHPPIDTKYLRLASVNDIGCFKLAAILSRATNKDYIDLYYILQDISLAELLTKAQKKMPIIDENIIVKSLVYFKDIEQEPIVFIPGKEIDFSAVKNFLQVAVKEYVGV